MDIKKFAEDTWSKAKDYAVEHKYEIETAVSDVVFGLGMAGLGYFAGVATENKRIAYNMQLIEYRRAANHDKPTDGRMSKDYGEYAKTTDKK